MELKQLSKGDFIVSMAKKRGEVSKKLLFLGSQFALLGD